MKKLILSLAMVMTMILVSTTESKAIIKLIINYSGVPPANGSCAGYGLCSWTWEIGLLANPIGTKYTQTQIGTNNAIAIVSKNAEGRMVLNIYDNYIGIINKHGNTFKMDADFELPAQFVKDLGIQYSKIPKGEYAIKKMGTYIQIVL
jgi:hypothetical protein